MAQGVVTTNAEVTADSAGEMGGIGEACRGGGAGQAVAGQRQLQGKAQALPQHQATHGDAQLAAEQALQLAEGQSRCTREFGCR